MNHSKQISQEENFNSNWDMRRQSLRPLHKLRPNNISSQFKPQNPVKNGAYNLKIMSLGKETFPHSQSIICQSMVSKESRITLNHSEKTQALTKDDIMWKEFQRTVKESGVVTPLAVQQILNKFVAERMNHVNVKLNSKAKRLSWGLGGLKSVGSSGKLSSLGSRLSFASRHSADADKFTGKSSNIEKWSGFKSLLNKVVDPHASNAGVCTDEDPFSSPIDSRKHNSIQKAPHDVIIEALDTYDKNDEYRKNEDKAGIDNKSSMRLKKVLDDVNGILTRNKKKSAGKEKLNFYP